MNMTDHTYIPIYSCEEPYQISSGKYISKNLPKMFFYVAMFYAKSQQTKAEETFDHAIGQGR